MMKDGMGHLLTALGIDIKGIQDFLTKENLQKFGDDLRDFVERQKRIETMMQEILDIARTENIPDNIAPVPHLELTCQRDTSFDSGDRNG